MATRTTEQCVADLPYQLPGQNTINIFTEIEAQATSSTPFFFQRLKKAGLIIAAIVDCTGNCPSYSTAYLCRLCGDGRHGIDQYLSVGRGRAAGGREAKVSFIIS